MGSVWQASQTLLVPHPCIAITVLCLPSHDCMAASAVVIVFVKLPVPGKVKTRLARGVGEEGAARFYKTCAERAVHTASRSAAWPCLFNGMGTVPQLRLSVHAHARTATPEQLAPLLMRTAMRSSQSLSGSRLLRGYDRAGGPCAAVAKANPHLYRCAGGCLRAAGRCG